MKIQRSFYIERDLYQRLKLVAFMEERRVSELIAEAIEQWLIKPRESAGAIDFNQPPREAIHIG